MLLSAIFNENTFCIDETQAQYALSVVPGNTRCIVLGMTNWRNILRDRMALTGLTQEGLAEKLKVTQGAIGHWMTGRRDPGLDTINKMLAAAGLPHMIVPFADEMEYELYASETMTADGVAETAKISEAHDRLKDNRVGAMISRYLEPGRDFTPSPGFYRLLDAVKGMKDDDLDFLVDLANRLRAGKANKQRKA